MNTYKVKKKKGNISVSIYLLIIFLSVSCLVLLKITKSNLDMEQSFFYTIKNDQEFELAENVLKVNFYESIKNQFIRTSSSEEFIKKYSNYNEDGYIEVFNKKYLDHNCVKISEYMESNSEPTIFDNGRYVEFYINLEYKNNRMFRTEVVKCRIFNPHIKLNDNDKKELIEGKTKWERQMFLLVN